jgi:Bacterial PH domain
MPQARFIPDAEFAPAPIGTRVRFATLLSAVAAFAVTVAAPVLMQRERHPPPWPVYLAVGIAPAVLAVIWFTARIRRYRLVGEELQIQLPLRTVRFPLEGLKDVAPDREALRGARKIAGNDGLGAVSGRFRSKRLGWFRAYVTDGERAVVLRWPDRCVVISPDQPSWFIETVRKRSGLSC